MKNIVKLTESQLKKIISESIKKIILERNFESDRRWENYIPPRIKDVDFYFFADSDYIRNVLNYNEDSPEIKEAVHCILNMANDETIPYITPFKVDLNSDDEIIDWDSAIESLPKNIRDLILEMVGEFIGQTNYFKWDR
jgi:hypothetical protein